jgi:hypothetical protein
VPGVLENVGHRLVLTDDEGAETTLERSVELAGDCVPPSVRFATNCADEVTVTITSVTNSGSRNGSPSGQRQQE